MALAVDLFCGLGGWSEGLLAEGWNVIGFDIERHVYGDQSYPGQLVLQDVLTLHGSQFKDVDLIVASPPCQEYSYMAMPWSRAKKIRRGISIRRTGHRETERPVQCLFPHPARGQRGGRAAYPDDRGECARGAGMGGEVGMDYGSVSSCGAMCRR